MPMARSIHSDDYELAQSEADRMEEQKMMAMASRQTSKTKTKLQSWYRLPGPARFGVCMSCAWYGARLWG